MKVTSRVRTLLPLLAAVYVACLIWQAPHTVHHFFEHDVQPQDECRLSAAADRSSGTTVDYVSIAPVGDVDLLIAVVAPAFCPRLTSSVLGPRAPPSAA